jgi:hypothetical protein
MIAREMRLFEKLARDQTLEGDPPKITNAINS